MVKADVKHNYYADLELPTTCSLDDVKKQYRKLALLYHPDRNAGKEEEFVPKFQAIQTAHEILGDPALRAKYDADRRKAGLYPNIRTSQPTTGNPYSATSAYPPPPRRTAPGTWQRPQQHSAPQGAAPTTPSGADRFSNFTRGAPTARKDPAQDRTNMFRAWQNMNNAQERQTQFQPNPRHPPPPAAQPSPNRPRPPPRQDTKLPSEEEIRAGMNYRKAPPQFDGTRTEERQSAWSAHQQANPARPGIHRTPTARTAKKQGFDPNAPGSDERPAGGSNYAHRHRSEDFGMPGSGAPYPPPPPGPPPQSPLSPSSSPTTSRMYGDPLRPFKSREGHEQQVPFTEGNRRRTPYSGSYGVGEKTEVASDGLRRSASTRDATKLHGQNGSSARARSTSPMGRQQSTKGHEQNGSQRTPFVNYSSSESSDDDRPMSSTPEGYESTPAPADPQGRSHSATHSERPKKVPTPPSKRFNGSSHPFSPPPPSDGAPSETEMPGMRQKTSNNIFTLPVDHDLFTPNSKSRSEESINTKFSPEGWNGAFTGAGGYFAPPPPSTARKPTSPPRRGSQRSGLRSATTHIPNGASSETDMPPPRRPFGSDGQHQQQPDSTTSEVRFSKEQWEKTFQDASWTWPPPPPKPPSPSKGAAKTRVPGRKPSKSNPLSATTGPQIQPHVVEEADEVTVEIGDDGTIKSSAPVLDEGDAMDIDSTPPNHQPEQQSDTVPQAESEKEPRLYSVPPSAWRQQQVNGQRRKSNSDSRRVQRGSAGEADSKLRASLDDLAHVEPIARSADGLKNLADIRSTLPFPSQAASTLPSQPLEPNKLQMPQVPKAPEPPSKLTKQSWHAFSLTFGAYLQAYHAFNKTMLAHFAARETQAQARMTGGFAWLEATGDTSSLLTGPSGFGSYLQGVKEDEQVRETWSLGCERHADACKAFEKTRERVRKLAAGGGLTDH